VRIVTQPGATTAATARRRALGGAAQAGGSRVKLTGALHRVQAGRPGGRPVLQAELGSDAGPVWLVWLGRDHIPGIEPGRVLVVEGTLSVQRGRPTIFNPRYDLGAGEPARDLASR
jgi:hypothetical protein